MNSIYCPKLKPKLLFRSGNSHRHMEYVVGFFFIFVSLKFFSAEENKNIHKYPKLFLIPNKLILGNLVNYVTIVLGMIGRNRSVSVSTKLTLELIFNFNIFNQYFSNKKHFNSMFLDSVIALMNLQLTSSKFKSKLTENDSLPIFLKTSRVV